MVDQDASRDAVKEYYGKTLRDMSDLQTSGATSGCAGRDTRSDRRGNTRQVLWLRFADSTRA